MPSNKLKILVSLYHRNPWWNIPAEVVQRIIQEVVPSEVKVAFGMQEILKEIVEADIYFGWRITKEVFQAAQKLKWFHSGAAGIGGSLFPELVESPLIVTNSKGVSASAIAEHIMGLMLALIRQLKMSISYQLRGYWAQEEIMSQPQFLQTLEGKSLGIIGLGHIGRELAHRAKCFGMRIIALKKYIPAKGIEGVDRLLRQNQLQELLKKSDFVVICASLTKQTWGLIGQRELSLMKPTAFLINVARGKIVKQEELIKALRQGIIAGAALDVVENEPLPQDSPLWNMENVIITPHIGGVFPAYWDKSLNLFVGNYKRFVRGEKLINLVDKKLGY